ncbi:MAG: hypothetical protein AMXMBFR64_56170 [Myxococcales bacterium]
MNADPEFPLLDALDQGFLAQVLADPDLVVVRRVKAKFDTTNRVADFHAGDLVLRTGDRVVVETDKGTNVATVVGTPTAALAPRRSLRRILRKASAEDRGHHDFNAQKEREAFRYCLERIRARSLDMKLVTVELMHSDNKAIFYFSAEGRVDFRALVKDLAAHLWTRIEMRQIGIRDEAKMVGGVGSCGRELCCSTWLPEFTPVTIKMAKYQGLVLNPQKVSGLCGRLMCCLGYEQDHYMELRRSLPRVGATVSTPDGVGRVKELHLLKKQVRVLVGETLSTWDVDRVAPAEAAPAEDDP